MRGRLTGFVWSYGQRLLIDLCLVVATLGALVALAAEMMPIYVKSAKLVEPVYFAKNIQTHMMIDAAFTGQRPTKSDLSADSETWKRSIQSFDVTESGNILILLHQDLGFKENNALGFNLNIQSPSDAFRFYSWHCGDLDPKPSLYISEPVKSTVPLIVSHTICRK